METIIYARKIYSSSPINSDKAIDKFVDELEARCSVFVMQPR